MIPHRLCAETAVSVNPEITERASGMADRDLSFHLLATVARDGFLQRSEDAKGEHFNHLARPRLCTVVQQ